MGAGEKQKRQTWLGGYVRAGKNGKKTFIIEKWIRGQHFHVSTRCNTERAALEQLKRFEADPYGFDPLAASGAPLEITAELVEKFARWMRDAKKDSNEWVRQAVSFLGDWAEDLAGKDLRALNVQRDLKAALAKRKSQRARAEVIKSFCTWLRREEGLLAKGTDATQDFLIPAAEPEKLRRRKALPREHIEFVLPRLSDATRDVLMLQLGTAWHISEVRRFATMGEILKRGSGKMLAVLTVKHKSGELVSQPIIEREHLEAAERIRARGRIPSKWTLVANLRLACIAVRAEQKLQGVADKDLMPHWRLGQMRHTVLTWAVEMGATPEQAAAFAHHRSPLTTKKFYIDLAVPTVTVPVLRLVKPEPETKEEAG